jgi:hypothetical protein
LQGLATAGAAVQYDFIPLLLEGAGFLHYPIYLPITRGYLDAATGSSNLPPPKMFLCIKKNSFSKCECVVSSTVIPNLTKKINLVFHLLVFLSSTPKRNVIK